LNKDNAKPVIIVDPLGINNDGFCASDRNPLLNVADGSEEHQINE
jgi:hypothetical protein